MISELLGRARHDVDTGALPSCQVAVARGGELLAFETFGAPADSVYAVMSCTKPLVAAAVWLLLGEGSLSVDTLADELVPGLSLDGVTVDHLLLHTCGFPTARVRPASWGSRSARREEMSQWRLTFEPGSRFEYHPTSAWWVLGEAIFSVTGLDHSSFWSSRVAAPLGLSSLWVGGVRVPDRVESAFAPVGYVGEPASPEELEASFGVREIRLPGMADDTLLELNSAAGRAAGVPGAGGVGSAADVALFFQALLANPGELWRPDVLADGTGVVRNNMADPWTGVPAGRTRGLVVAGDDGMAHMRQAHFGGSVSGSAFGHAGAGGQIAWADPVSGLSFCYLTNGLDRNVLRESRRCYGLSTRAAQAV